jgi:transketolase N-terminal domain/subunit
MSEMEKLELDAHRSDITSDVKKLVEKYRAIFGWDIPEIDQNAADKLILKAIQQSLNQVEQDIL